MKKYLKIWLTTLIVTVTLCILYSIAITYVVENQVQQMDGDTTAPQYLDTFAQVTEQRMNGTLEVEGDKIIADAESLWTLYYGAVNDKVGKAYDFVPFGRGWHVPIYDLATVMWIADRDGNIVERGDYAVFARDKERVRVDVIHCLSREDLQKLTEILKKVDEDWTVLPGDALSGDGIEVEMTRYVVRDGIYYPLEITVMKAGAEYAVFEGGPEFAFETSEIQAGQSYVLVDEKLDITDPNYIELKEYTKSQLKGYLRKQEIDWTYQMRITTSNGKIGNCYLWTTGYLLNDGAYFLCKGAISNYGPFLRRLKLFGWAVLAGVNLLLALLLTISKRRKLQKAEYERTITNALAHDYKSSLMIQRAYAENLLYGVSEDKKHLYEQKIMDEIDKMDIRTERLLSMFRASSGGRLATDEEIDVQELCRELIQNYAELSQRRGLTWSIRGEVGGTESVGGSEDVGGNENAGGSKSVGESDSEGGSKGEGGSESVGDSDSVSGSKGEGGSNSARGSEDVGGGNSGRAAMDIGAVAAAKTDVSAQATVENSAPFKVKADKILLSMALDNLINNACKYSLMDSEIILTFTADSLTIVNRWRPIEKFLKSPKLFWEPYVTGDDARTSRNSGIGLSSARQILKRMRLKLSVKADENKIQFTVKR